MNKWIFLATAIASFNINAEIYKCNIDGVETYSQDPCAEDAQAITVTPPSKINSGENALSKLELEQECLAFFKSNGGFKDPDSIKTSGSVFGWVQDDSGARRVLQLKINAKNSYGGYGGSKSYPCYLNHSGTKLSKHQYLIRK